MNKKTKKIYILTCATFTESDNYLHHEVKTYTESTEAYDAFNRMADESSEELRWGAAYDNEDHEDDYGYDVDEERMADYYEGSSEAYEGYYVKIDLDEVEVDCD